MENKATKTKVLKGKKKDIPLGRNPAEKEFIKIMHNMFNQLSQDAQFSIELVNQYVVEYLKGHKKQVLEVYRQKNRGNVLYYLVWLRKSGIHERGVLSDFENIYENSPYSSRFPVILVNVPHEIEKEFRKELDTNTYQRVI